MDIWKITTQKSPRGEEAQVYLESSEGASVYMDTMPIEDVEENERIGEILADLNAGKWVGIPESGDLFCVIPPDGSETYSAETIADLVTGLAHRNALLEAVADVAREVDDSVSHVLISNRRLLAAFEKLHGALDALDGAEKESDDAEA